MKNKFLIILLSIIILYIPISLGIFQNIPFNHSNDIYSESYINNNKTISILTNQLENYINLIIRYEKNIIILTKFIKTDKDAGEYSIHNWTSHIKYLKLEIGFVKNQYNEIENKLHILLNNINKGEKLQK